MKPSLVPEHFHHPNKKSCTHRGVTPHFPLPTNSRQPLSSFLSLWICLFGTLRVNGIIQHVASCVWLLLLSITIARIRLRSFLWLNIILPSGSTTSGLSIQQLPISCAAPTLCNGQCCCERSRTSFDVDIEVFISLGWVRRGFLFCFLPETSPNLQKTSENGEKNFPLLDSPVKNVSFAHSCFISFFWTFERELQTLRPLIPINTSAWSHRTTTFSKAPGQLSKSGNVTPIQ